MKKSPIYFQFYSKVFSHDKGSAATSAEIKFGHYSYEYWKFPKIVCIQVVETKIIFMGPCTPIKTTKKPIYLKKKQNL